MHEKKPRRRAAHFYGHPKNGDFDSSVPHTRTPPIQNSRPRARTHSFSSVCTCSVHVCPSCFSTGRNTCKTLRTRPTADACCSGKINKRLYCAPRRVPALHIHLRPLYFSLSITAFVRREESLCIICRCSGRYIERRRQQKRERATTRRRCVYVDFLCQHARRAQR